jgi:hypothetical protein
VDRVLRPAAGWGVRTLSEQDSNQDCLAHHPIFVLFCLSGVRLHRGGLSFFGLGNFGKVYAFCLFSVQVRYVC